MSYEQYDVSTEGGAPVHLFHFNYNGTDYRFTDLVADYTALSQTWTAANLKAGEFRQSSDFSKSTLDIELPRNDTFAELFTTGSQEGKTTLTIYRGYINDPDEEYNVYWKGRVTTTGVTETLVTLKCDPIQSSMGRSGLTDRFTRNCAYALYGTQCGVDKDGSNYVLDDTIDSIAGKVITVFNANAESDGYYIGGIIVAADGVERFIRDHTGNDITIDQTYSGFTAASAVRLHPGCDRLLTTCKNKFNNSARHGGYPYIPNKNPNGGGSLI